MYFQLKATTWVPNVHRMSVSYLIILSTKGHHLSENCSSDISFPYTRTINESVKSLQWITNIQRKHDHYTQHDGRVWLQIYQKIWAEITLIRTSSFIWFLAPLAKGQRGLCYGSSSVVRASVNSILVSAIETTFLNQSGPNLHEVFMATRSPMSSIMSKISPVTPELMPLKYWKLLFLDLVSTIETTFLNQSGPKLHKVFIDTRSRMSSIMSKIGPVTTKLFALELPKIAVLNLVSSNRDHISQSIWTKVTQSIYRHKISDEFDNEQNPPSNNEVICPWIIGNSCLCMYMYIHHLLLL